ncbi:NUDIX domain-containing protein [Candidatus Saccharibacteria bacterium]|nr:MAG: NUDIX domain-containing protein [Candidatus Saccharibacteria bacterium]
MSDDEIVDVVNEQGIVQRQVLKTQAHEHGWLHKTVIGCLRYGDDFALVQQAADRQDAGQWVNPVGGHVQAGESNDAALLRECEEEIGTRNVTHTLLGVARFHRQVIGRDENHLFYVYEIRTADKIMLGSEAVAIHTFSVRELIRLCEEGSDMLGDAYYFVVERFFPELLPKAYVPRFSP